MVRVVRILGYSVFRKLYIRTPGSITKARAQAKTLTLRPKGPEAKAKAKARGYETEVKILASRPVWPRGFNISFFSMTQASKLFTSKQALCCFLKTYLMMSKHTASLFLSKKLVFISNFK